MVVRPVAGSAGVRAESDARRGDVLTRSLLTAGIVRCVLCGRVAEWCQARASPPARSCWSAPLVLALLPSPAR